MDRCIHRHRQLIVNIIGDKRMDNTGRVLPRLEYIKQVMKYIGDNIYLL